MRYAIIGLAIAIAVAWTSAVSVDLWANLRQRNGLSHERGPCWIVTTKRRPAARYVYRAAVSSPEAHVAAGKIPVPSPDAGPRAKWARANYDSIIGSNPDCIDAPGLPFIYTWGRSAAPVPYWSRARTPPGAGATYDNLAGFTEDGRGWPFICLVSEAATTMYLGCATGREHGTVWMPAGWLYGDVTWGIPIAGAQGSDLMPRALPLRPVWAGLILDTAFYGGLAWLIVAAPTALRRRARRRRGQCPTCGYPASPAPNCPECGAQRDNSQQPTANS